MSSDDKLPPPTFALPSPVFSASQPPAKKSSSHFLSPNGIQMLSRNEQPPPMYGPRGATIPAKHLAEYGKGEPSKPDKEYCDACDWEFNSLGALRSHKLEHETCVVEGCQFRAHPKIVDKHIELTHQSGIFEQIKKLDNPEEIAKWRDARKKRYPTIQNVLLRQQMQKEKKQRGEKLEPRNNRFGRNSERTTGPQPQKRPAESQKSFADKKPRINERRNKDKVSSEKPSPSKTEEKKSEATPKGEDKKPVEKEDEPRNEDMWNGHLPMFTGTSKWKDYNRVQVKGKTAALMGLLGDYGSGSETSDEDESDGENDVQPCCSHENIENGISQNQEDPASNEDEPIDRTLDVPLDTPPKAGAEMSGEDETPGLPSEQVEDAQMSGDDGPPDESPIERESGLPLKEELPSTSEKHSKAGPSKLSKKKLSGLESNMGFLLRKTRKQNTMLEKLLESQIIHERNVLFQCVRHVVSNNFFQENKKM